MLKNTNKIRVGFVIDDGMDQPDGVQQYVLALGNYLSRKGHYVRYLTGETRRKDLDGVMPLSSNLKVRFNGNTLSTPLPTSKKRISKLLKEENFDVLHVQMPYSPFMAGRVIKLAPPKTKIIGTFHVLPVGKFQHFGTKLLGLWLKRSLGRFDKFLSVSPPAREFAKDVFKIDSEVLPNPVDISRFRRSSAVVSAKRASIVYLGRLVPRKGCMHLLKALDLLLEQDERADIDIHICGDGDQRQKLQHFIEHSRLKDRAVMHGFVSEEEKVRFLNDADMAVFPSLSGESFGIVLLEAMAAGSGVVLAGNNPGYSSVMHTVPECLFDPNDTEALAKKIRELLKEKNYRRIHELQQRLVKNFDINIVGEKLLEVYKSA